MNRLSRAAFLALAGILLGAWDTSAQYLANDLVLGFNRVDNGGSGTQPADYVINLGNFQTAVGVGGSSSVNLSGMFDAGTFNTLYGSLSSGVTMSVVGGNGASSGRDIFATAPRLTLGSPNLPGSEAPGPLASTFMANGANDVSAMAGPSGLNLSAAHSMTVAQSDANSFNTWILSTTPPSYYSGTGIDPRGTSGGTVLYEDLYLAKNNVNGNNFEYVGYFTLDTGNNPSLTFTPSAVPEASTYSILAGGGLFLLWLRRLINANKA